MRCPMEHLTKAIQLMPMPNNCGLLRDRGRIGSVEGVVFNVRRPNILPRKHRVAGVGFSSTLSVQQFKNYGQSSKKKLIGTTNCVRFAGRGQ